MIKENIDRVGIELYSRWKEYKLGDVLEIKYGKDHKEINDGNIPIYGSGGIMRYGDKALYDKKSILIPRKGSLNNIFYKDEPFWTVDTMFWTKINEGKVYPKFLFYQLTTVDYTNLNVGSAVPSLTVPVIEAIDILLPPIKEQTAIADILNSLDDKIDLLHRQNKTLEQLAETLFRKWFVEEAEESWEVVRLKKLGKIICGKTPSKKVSSYFNGEYPFIKIPDMHGNTYVFESIDSLTEQGLNSQQNKTIPPKSICVSCIATVGLVVMNAKTSQTNQQINSIIPSKDICRYFIYLKMLSIKDELLAMASGGTATDNLNTGDFSKIEIQFPMENVLKEFHEIVSPMFDKIYTNQTQIRTLTHTRDTLLPKLMSGEIRLNTI
ncbi:MAG: restriction endonuclease subunit S [Daejeonella sp.]